VVTTLLKEEDPKSGNSATIKFEKTFHGSRSATGKGLPKLY